MRKLFAFLFFALFLAPAPLGARPFSRGRIVVHPGGRYLQYADGRPFFYLGDTAWELFHRTTREEARLYLEDRARKGFTVIQAVCLAERDGLRVPNAYGDLPFADAGFTRPNERYFAYVDEVVAMADSLGLVIGLLPVWGDGPEIFTTEGRAEAFGRYLGERYRIRRNIIWILGGDRPPEGREPILRAFARGIACGVAGREDYSACLITYHPWGKSSSGDWLHDEPWLAFNMQQNGHAYDFDLWERIAYNALPAALSPDGWAHQYDQQVNQIRIDRYPRAWYNNKPDANVFGLEPNYGCCTANLHQGYPKFTAHLWMAVRGGGLAAQSYAPCEVLWRAGQTRIRLTVGGDYPTQERVRIRLKMEGEARFPILLRIPGWAEGAHAEVAGERLEGPPGQYLRLERVWCDGDEIELTLPMQVRTEKWHHQTLAVYRGPVLFALPVPAKWEYKGEMPLCDRWAEPQGPWNYALVPEEGFAVEGGGARIACSAVRCPGWVEKGGSADDPPVRPLRGDAPVERISLVPYAQAPLRVAQFPWARNG